MAYLKVDFITQLLYCCLLIPIYLWTLWQAVKGKKFKLIVQITSLLLASVIGYVLVLIANWEQY
jgi:hypothetical protein